MSPRVAVVGAGPVGLFQALALHQAGIEPVVLERRTEPHRGSRSIGIHPPSLEALEALDLVEPFLAAGVQVRRGHAVGDGAPIGTVDFTRCGGRYPFVLALPQHRTEALLEAALAERVPGALRRGAEVRSLEARDDAVSLDTASGPLEVDWVVACDGRRSRVRELLGIPFAVEAYEGEYGMEDHPDQTPYGDDAAVFLTEAGLVESFPLPGGVRRWVARTDGAPLRDTIRARTGFELPADGSTSSFRAERGLAGTFVRGRVVLGGDAAHVVSPIGGQGMNLGWLGANRITRALGLAMRGEPDALARDARVRRRMAKAAARRAEANMWLGRPTAQGVWRERLVGALMRRPLVDGLARAFTMRGLRWGV